LEGAVHLEQLAGREPCDWTTAELAAYVGGLSRPSKMPGWSYGLPARECLTGSKLRAVSGSTCGVCYAFERGNYRFRNVELAQYRRLESIRRGYWSDAMAELISRKRERYFRWHDSGDLQSVAHLRSIVRVCELTPSVRHWLPTREYRIVAEYRSGGGQFPPNLTVRMSAHMIGGKLPSFPAPLTVSSVSRQPGTYPGAHECPARHQDNECGTCRACWDRGVPHVDYPAH